MSDELLKWITKVDDHGKSTLLQPPSQLAPALANAKAKGLPPIEVGPLQGQSLSIQARLIKAKNVLEIGTLGGYSTIWFASTGAHVTSIEINPKHRDVALENTRDYKDQIEVILGAALDVLPQLDKEGRKFDMVFIDADWGEQWEYFEWAVKLTRSGGCIYVDNVVRTIGEDEAEGKGIGVQDTLFDRVGRAKGVTASMVPTISGHKGRADEMVDGYLLAVVH